MDAAWWGMATITTVGYGDVRPTSGVGRVVGAMFMVLGIACFSLITAEISTVLTINALTTSVSSLKDLADGNVVCTTYGDVGQTVLQQANVGSRLVFTTWADECYQGLINGTIDAVVRTPAAGGPRQHARARSRSQPTNGAGLRRAVQRIREQYVRRPLRQGGARAAAVRAGLLTNDAQVVGGSLGAQEYAYAMGKNNPIRDRINYGVLKALADTAFVNSLTAKYIGDPDGRRFSSTDGQLGGDNDYTYAYILLGIIGGIIVLACLLRAWEEWQLTKVLRAHPEALSNLGRKYHRVPKEQALGGRHASHCFE